MIVTGALLWWVCHHFFALHYLTVSLTLGSLLWLGYQLHFEPQKFPVSELTYVEWLNVNQTWITTRLLSENLLWKRLSKSVWRKERFYIGKSERITKDKEQEKCFLFPSSFPKLFQRENIFRQRGFKLFPVKKRCFYHGQRESFPFVFPFEIFCLFALQKLFFFLIPFNNSFS